MKKIEGILLRACGFAVAILILLYLFAVATSFIGPAIGFPMFLIILAFGLIISVANLIFSVKSIKLPFRVAIHFAVLLVAFCIIFVYSGNLTAGGDAAVFTAISIFIFLYALIFTLTYFIKRAISAADSRLEATKRAAAEKGSEKEKKPGYQPRYK